MLIFIKILLLLFVVLGCVFWLVQLLFTFLTLKKIPALADVSIDNITEWPKISVVIPARNEEKTIESAVLSRLEDDYPGLELILIDDRSTDSTPRLVDKLASLDARIKPVHLKQLPAGWVGKPYAMHAGYLVSKGAWLLFSDADVHMEPGALKRAMAFCLQKNLGHLALFPRLNAPGLLLGSVISMFMTMLVAAGRIWAVEDPNSGAVMGAGAFNLVRRDSYERSGGFESLRQEIADDVSLGYILKKSGTRTAVINGCSHVNVTLYDSLKDMAIGSERATFTSLGFSFPRIAALCLACFLFEIFPLLLFIPSGFAFMPYLGILMTGIALYVSITLNRWNCRPALPSLLFPVSAIIFLVFGVRAGYLGWKRGGIYWRGTFYPTEELKKGRKLKI